MTAQHGDFQNDGQWATAERDGMGGGGGTGWESHPLPLWHYLSVIPSPAIDIPLSPCAHAKPRVPTLLPAPFTQQPQPPFSKLPH